MNGRPAIVVEVPTPRPVATERTYAGVASAPAAGTQAPSSKNAPLGALLAWTSYEPGKGAARTRSPVGLYVLRRDRSREGQPIPLWALVAATPAVARRNAQDPSARALPGEWAVWAMRFGDAGSGLISRENVQAIVAVPADEQGNTGDLRGPHFALARADAPMLAGALVGGLFAGWRTRSALWGIAGALAGAFAGLALAYALMPATGPGFLASEARTQPEPPRAVSGGVVEVTT